MAVTFTVEDGTGVSGANSLCTVAFADDYFVLTSHKATTWDGYTTDEKQNAIMEGTRVLNYCVEWEGWPTDYERDFPFPRANLPRRSGYYYQPTEIPTEVKQAVCELGYALKQSDRTSSEESAPGITGVGLAGVITVSMDKSSETTQTLSVVPDFIATMIRHLGKVRGSGNSFTPNYIIS